MIIKPSFKKLFLIIFLLLGGINTFFIGSINASETSIKSPNEVSKPLVCVKGKDYRELLNYEGYKIVNSTVNFFVKGDYTVIYEAKQDIYNLKKGDVISKKVSIVETSNVFDDIYYDINYINIGQTINNAIMVDLVQLNNGDIYTLEYFEANSSFSYVLTKIVNNSIIYSRIIKDQQTGFPLKITSDEERLIVVGHTYNETTKIDVLLIMLDFNAKIITETTIGGENVDICKGIMINNQGCYIYGNTKSNTSYFNDPQGRKAEDGFIMKISLDNLYPQKTFMINNLYLNSINHLIIYQDYVYAMHEYVDISSTSQHLKQQLLKLTLDLEQTNISNFVNSYALTPIKLLVTNDQLYFLTYQFDYGLQKYTSNVYHITDQLAFVLIDKYINYQDENIQLVDFKIEKDKEIFLYAINGEQEGSYLVVKENGQMIMDLLLQGENYDAFRLMKNGYRLLTSKKYLISYNYIKGIYEGNTLINEENDQYGNNQIIINNETPKLSDKSQGDVNIHCFGTYLLKYIYETPMIDFAYHQEVCVQSQVSIEDQEVYDQNICLEFNGTGYLNDKKITSGHIIEEVGTYTFELIGKDGMKKTYYFQVEDLSIKKEITFQKMEVERIDFNQQPDPNQQILDFGILEDQTITKRPIYWILLFPITVLLGGIFMCWKVK